jgi:hypothetical protein
VAPNCAGIRGAGLRWRRTEPGFGAPDFGGAEPKRGAGRIEGVGGARGARRGAGTGGRRPRARCRREQSEASSPRRAAGGRGAAHRRGPRRRGARRGGHGLRARGPSRDPCPGGTPGRRTATRGWALRWATSGAGYGGGRPHHVPRWRSARWRSATRSSWARSGARVATGRCGRRLRARAWPADRNAFLSPLAKEQHVSASTQNHALAALLISVNARAVDPAEPPRRLHPRQTPGPRPHRRDAERGRR